MTGFGRSSLIIGVSLIAAGCGKRGALVYPDMLVPAAPSAVTAMQSGAAVKLRFSLPDKDRTGKSVHGLAGVKISRRVTDGDSKDVCRSCMADYALFRTLYLDRLSSDTQRMGGRLVLLDSDVSVGNAYSYRIMPFTADGVDGVSSQAADVRMDQPQSAPALKIESFPTELKLYVSLPPLKSGRLLGYNVYRSTTAGMKPYQPLNREPVEGGEYADSTSERGVTYRYTVRALIKGATGTVAESDESPAVEGMLKDDE